MTPKEVLLVHSLKGCKTTAIVGSILDKHDIDHMVIHRDHLQKRLFKGKDLVIVVGGDGTFLRATHLIKDNTPILGVNCDVTKNEGFFTRANRDNFEKKLKLIIAGKHKITLLQRLSTKLNSKQMAILALNDIFLGERKAYRVSRYWLNSEFHKSSGVIVSAPAGTHAWYRSAGGRPRPINSHEFAFLVREPYTGRLVKPIKTHGILSQKDILTIRSDCSDGIIVFDSISKEFSFRRDDVVKIAISDKPIHFVEF